MLKGEGEKLLKRFIRTKQSHLVILILLLLVLLSPNSLIFFGYPSSSQTLYAHAETTMIGGNSFYMLESSPTDGPATILSESAVSTGRKLMGRWVYPLTDIASIEVSTWTVTYRAMKSASAKDVVAHGDIDILIRKADGTIRDSIGSDVANSPSLTLTNVWETLTGTYDWTAYTVVDQTDYLEVVYCIEVITPQSSKSVSLLVDDGTLPLADQTKIENIMYTNLNQAPVASFTFSPSNPLIYDAVTFNASASYDPDGSIVSYTWDFGDGNVTTVTVPIITHVYTTTESTVNYTVTLTVTDDESSTGSVTDIVPVTNPTILYVSLPTGTYVGPNPDNWVSQCWLLNITALSETFTIRINNTHASFTSDDTHLIIALNSASYEYLESLTVSSTTIPKSSFIYGKPEPYGFTLTWEEDVYPTWFIDIYVVGTIDPQCHKDVEVSVTFFNTTSVRMHFDAYGSQDSPPPPTSKGHVTHNAHEKDSTVLFWPPPVVKYYLTVKTDPEGITTTPGEDWYDECTDVELIVPLYVPDEAGLNGERHMFTHWTVDDKPKAGNPITVHMNANHTAIAHYVKQYEVTFNQSGVGSDYTGTVVNVDGTDYGVGDLSVSFWWDEGSTHDFAFQSPLLVSPDAKRYVWASTSGLSTLQSGSLVVSTSGSVTGNYKTQYYFTVTSPHGSPTPTSGWFDSGTSITASVTSPSPGPTGTRYVCTGWDGTGVVPASGTGSSTTFTLTLPSTITWNWKTQYYLTVRTDPSGIVTIPGEGWYDDLTSVPLTAPSVAGYNFLNWDVDGTSQGAGVASITVSMIEPHTATAHYKAIAVPVGGYSFSLTQPIEITPLIGYTMILAIFGAVITLFRRKRK